MTRLHFVVLCFSIGVMIGLSVQIYNSRVCNAATVAHQVLPK